MRAHPFDPQDSGTPWPSGANRAIALEEAGLVFGIGTVLARMTGGDQLAVDADEDRLLALLSVAYNKPAPPDLLRHVKEAANRWHRGDRVLANLRLVFAHLPKLHDPADAYRMRLAENLLDRGLPPRALMKELGLDASGLNRGGYNPNQPRVPAGNGRISGQFGFAPDGTPIDAAASADDPQSLKMARAAANAAGLTTAAERRAFHDLITGQGITNFQELVEIAKSVKQPP